MQRAIADPEYISEVVVSAFAGFVRRHGAPTKRQVVWFRHGVCKEQLERQFKCILGL
jgi:hypothetical protein